MNSRLVKEGLRKFSEVLSFNYPAVGWYFSSEEMEESYIFRKDKWVCMFMYLKMMMTKNKKICFSEDHDKACAGAAKYFGFTELGDDGGVFLAEVERFCKDIEISKAYTKWSATLTHPPKSNYLYMEKLENIDDSREIEVANLFPAGTTNLAKLIALSNYDRNRMVSTDNVLIPDASGCQSIFTIPYHEKFLEHPKCIIGLMDPMARNYVPEDMMLFSMPANRFVEMANNIEGSFLDKTFQSPTGF